MRGLSIAGLAFVALALATACGGGSSNKEAHPTPSIDYAADKARGILTAAPKLTAEARAQPTPAPTGTPLVPGADVRSCTAADIAAAHEGSNAMTQQPILYFGVGNMSSTPCQLERAPELRFLGPTGEELPILPVPTWDGIYQGPVLLLPGLGNIARPLKIGQANITLTYSTATCHGPAFTPATPAVGIELVLPDPQNNVPVDMRGTSLGPCHESVGVVYQPVR